MMINKMTKLYHRKNFARCDNCGNGKDISDMIKEAEKRGKMEMIEKIKSYLYQVPSEQRTIRFIEIMAENLHKELTDEEK